MNFTRILPRSLSIAGLACAVVAPLGIAAPATPKPKPQPIPQGAVNFEGHAANPARVLVRWNSPGDIPSTVLRIEGALRGEDAQILGARPTAVSVVAYPNIEGVGIVEFGDTAAWRTAAMSGGDIAATSAGASGAAIASAVQLKHRMALLRSTGLFAYVEPDYIQHAYANPGDTGFADGRLWGLRNTGQNGGVSGIDTQAVQAWDLTTGSENVVVAVIDTGIRYTHQDLAGNMWRNPGEIAGNGVDDDSNGFVDDVFGINAINRSGDPLDDNGHGSHCAGTIGGTANDGGDLVGVAWTVRLMGLKFLSASGSGANSDALACIDYAVAKGANIISGSYGGGGASQSTLDAIERARQAGILCVFAAGNESNNNDTNPSYPAGYASTNIISVAAIDRSGNLANFSNFGATSVDLAAPGVQIFSCNFQNDSAYQTISGTSMATPHVAGVAALLKARFPSDNHVQLRERLLTSTRPLPSLQGKTATGGMVQARTAMETAEDGILEVSVSIEPSPLRVGDPATLGLRVSDFSPLAGATATGTLGTTSLIFRDDGVAPDNRANDGTYTARTSVPQVASGTINLAVSVNAAGKNPFSSSTNLPVVARAANDDFAAAAVLDPTTAVVNATNANCTRENAEPVHAGNSGGRSVWWKWTAPAGGQMQISTVGSAFDTILGVYTGSSLAALTTVAANDDTTGSLNSAVEFSATSGTTYFIAVDGFDGASGPIVLNAKFEGTGGGNLPPAFVRQPATATFQQGATITLSVEVAGTPVPALRWSRGGTDLSDGGRISGSTTTILTITNAVATDGGNYRVTATNTAGSAQSIVATVTVDVALVRPPNDDFAQRSALVGATAQTTGSNSGATAENLEPVHAGNAAGRSVWWTWTAPQTGAVSVDTFGSAFDTVLAVYRGTAIATVTSIASNNDAPGRRQSRVTFTAEAGVQYAFAVDSVGQTSGLIVLNLAQGVQTGEAPVITWQPIDTPLLEGFEGVLAVAATGPGPITYRWWKDGSPLDGATEPFVSVAFSQLSDAGEYFVVISNANGQVRSNTVTVTVEPISRPPNDDIEDAIPIALFGETAIARLTGATREEGEPFHADGEGPTMWWTWAPFFTGSATITTEGSITEAVEDLDTVLAVYTLNAQDELVLVAENDDVDDFSVTSEVTFNGVEGTTYYIAVGGFDVDDTGLVILDVPLSDLFRPTAAPAVLLHPLSFFAGIGNDAAFFVGNGGSPTPDIQWQISLNGGTTWTNLADGPGVSGVDTLVLQLESIGAGQNGELYRARLSNSEGTTHTIGALLGVLPRPPNDDFDAAFAIPPGVSVVTGSSYGATAEDGEPEHDVFGTASVWWTWQSSGSGRAVFDTLGSNYDTVLAVYTGSSVSALTMVAANDDFGDSFQSKIEFTASAGTTYRIAVSGFLGDYGSIKLQTPSDISPEITLPPVGNVRVTSGGTVTIAAGATGNPTPQYRWQRSTNGGATWTDLADDGTFSGTDSATLFITGASNALNANQFRLQATNSIGAVTSAPSILAVQNPIVQMVNLSTRAISLGGDRVIIPGFVVSGAATKRVLIRAVGPKLQDFGLGNFLPDPVLSVFRGGESAALATNDSWGTQEPGRPDPGTAGNEIGAFALTSGDTGPTNDPLSAALVLDLQPGAYSAVARDTMDRTGVGIVEIYDMDDANTGGPRLVNVSNRGFVGTGTEVMIPGFVVSGNGPRRYLIRAVGPKLADFGLPANTLLADPKVSVVSGETEVAANDDWVVQTGGEGTATDVQTISEQIGAFALGPDATFPTNDQQSAALIVWLDPGAYTVVVSSTTGGSGLAIAEVYEVP